ncbi:Uncharacterised protein [Serratia fonticola]|uniref:Uncharacterized protein n=1 Tax=Serratia fonticola TaxID=47917 RepID=A0A4U9TKV3_SERFO|nr:Uncharacterised protein [Serratia fonticola]
MAHKPNIRCAPATIILSATRFSRSNRVESWLSKDPKGSGRGQARSYPAFESFHHQVDLRRSAACSITACG